jgi:hypothetical protein
MKRIGVIDGQGGGIGSAIIRQVKNRYGEALEIVALGTNAIATAQMLKAKANRGASGENAIVQTAPRMDAILGPLGIIMAHAMMGEVTPRMAEAVSASRCPKMLLPLCQEPVSIAGAPAIPLPRLIEELIDAQLAPFLADGAVKGQNHV